MLFIIAVNRVQFKELIDENFSSLGLYPERKSIVCRFAEREKRKSVLEMEIRVKNEKKVSLFYRS